VVVGHRIEVLERAHAVRSDLLPPGSGLPKDLSVRADHLELRGHVAVGHVRLQPEVQGRLPGQVERR
jgi:hypothetical protein